MKPILAVAQMTSTDDIEANFRNVEFLARKAKSFGASLVCFPENFAYIPKSSDPSLMRPEPLSGPLFSKYQNLASDLQIEISYGGFHEHSDDQIFNTHVVVSKSGEITAKYRKIHLFQVNIPNGPNFDEAKNFSPGDLINVVPSDVGVLGLSICFDLRFPELYRLLSSKGAEILLVPSAFTTKTGAAHWETLLRARAIENQCYVAAAAQQGVHHPLRETYGHAMIVDPFGTILAQCSEKTDVAVAEIDVDYLERVRAQMPMIRRIHECS